MRTEILEGEKRFSPQEYLSYKQIQSLFARFAKKKKSCLPYLQENKKNNYEDEEIETNLQKVMRAIVSDDKNVYNTTDWVAIFFNKMWYPGEITDIENNEIKVKCMKRYGNNTFTFSEEDHYWYKEEEIICKIIAPVLMNTRFFCLSEIDLSTTCELLKK